MVMESTKRTSLVDRSRRRRPSGSDNENDEEPPPRKPSKRHASSKQEKQMWHDAAEEAALTELLFGKPSHTPVVSNTSRPEKPSDNDVHPEPTVGPLFQLDWTGDTSRVEQDEDQGTFASEKPAPVVNPSSSRPPPNSLDAPAWMDDDDEDIAVNIMGAGHSRLRKLRTSRLELNTTAMTGAELQKRLRLRYEQSVHHVLARTDWADVQKNKEHELATTGEDTDDIVAHASTTASYLIPSTSSRHSSTSLPPNRIRMVRCPDLNQVDQPQPMGKSRPRKGDQSCTIQSVCFHPGSNPSSPLCLTAGFDKTLRFYQVNQQDNHAVGNLGDPDGAFKSTACQSAKIHGIHCKFPRFC
jgi:hypothetical protein